MDTHKEEACLAKKDLEETKSQLESSEAENCKLSEELTKEKEGTALIVAELQGSQSELDGALQKITRLETENLNLINSLRDSQATLVEKLEVRKTTRFRNLVSRLRMN